MFRKQYNQLNEKINPDKNLVQDTIHKAERFTRKSDSKFRKPIFVLVSICLCISFAMPVLAANVEPIYQLMYMVSPSVAQFFMPVRKSDEDNGIKMEVISAYVHDNIAEIYITMQDLTEDRIDETTDLFDSYSINCPFESSAYCECVGYNESTKTATFLITIKEWGIKEISGDKITFTVREFISHKTTKENVKIDLELDNYKTESEFQIQSTNGGSSVNKDFELPKEGKFLVPKATIYSIMDNLYISNVGFIDGKLHIQMQVTEKSLLDPHGFFYFIDEYENKLDVNYRLSYNDNINGASVTYDEFIFDLEKEKLQDYSLYGDFYEAGLNTKGNWQVTFPLE